VVDTLYSFFETPIFMRRLNSVHLLKLLFAIEHDLLKNPERGEVIQSMHGPGRSG
jgi:hypothetical protein